ncbi:MAG TPA: hypothetical protein VKG03_04380 [Solirubrobacterales bacterium]|nr:hypothetical protein [Solirubrobacterales bacterium]
MNRSSGKRLRVGTVLAAALGALAMLAIPSVAAARDRNHDHIPDRWEKRHHLSLKVNQAGRDQDGDGLPNRAEFLAGDNPRNADSNNDGVPDGQENAGTIQSFDPASGKLVIALFGGDTISGMVTEQTEIQCEGAPSAASASDSQQGDDNQGEDEGQSGEDEGDDSGPESSSSGDEGESGDGNDESGNDNGDNANCTTADLTPGTVVRQAALQLENGTAAFEEVELAG